MKSSPLVRWLSSSENRVARRRARQLQRSTELRLRLEQLEIREVPHHSPTDVILMESPTPVEVVPNAAASPIIEDVAVAPVVVIDNVPAVVQDIDAANEESHSQANASANPKTEPANSADGEILKEVSKGGTGDQEDSQPVDIGGNYDFSQPKAGTYSISETQPAVLDEGPES